MIKSNHTITFLAGEYIARLFAEKLPDELVFHSFHHTANVVRGVRTISKHLELDNDQKEQLILAAWFHDSGHVISYSEHEEESQKIALNWLLAENYPPDKIDSILNCIQVTRLPQRPFTLMEETMCDADLFHLSLKEYCHLQFQLREEIKRVFHREYSDLAWMEENLQFLNNHHYFTPYGKTVLEPMKRQNMKKCEQLVTEYR